MQKQKILVLVASNYESKLKSRISAQACKGWEEHFHFLPLAERRNSKKQGIVPKEESTDNILNLWYDFSFSKIIAISYLLFEPKRLEDESVDIKLCNSNDVMFKFINNFLKKRNLHWLYHAQKQCSNSDINQLNPQAWKQQFADLGCSWVGEALLKQLSVISGNELNDAFRQPDAEIVGFKALHTYYCDKESGSSSISVKDTLEHIYRDKEVATFRPKDIDSIDAEIIYIYEDGLWSGKELVDRLTEIHSYEKQSNTKKILRFYYATTSDAGLLIGRSFLTKNGLTHIQIQPGRIAHYNFLERNFTLEYSEKHRFINSEEERKSIDNAVMPYSFQDDVLWRGRAKEGEDICLEIGRQLVSPWLVKKNMEKSSSSELTEQDIDFWALGACKYASMTVFPKSSPKPSLPLLWLGGEVQLGDKTINWRPLFSDIRRS